MPRTIFTAEPAAKLYDSQKDIHGEAMAANRHGREAEAEFLRGMSLTARRWADAAAA